MSGYLIVRLHVCTFESQNLIFLLFFKNDSSKHYFFLHWTVLFEEAEMCVPIKVRYGVL